MDPQRINYIVTFKKTVRKLELRCKNCRRKIASERFAHCPLKKEREKQMNASFVQSSRQEVYDIQHGCMTNCNRKLAMPKTGNMAMGRFPKLILYPSAWIMI